MAKEKAKRTEYPIKEFPALREGDAKKCDASGITVRSLGSVPIWRPSSIQPPQIASFGSPVASPCASQEMSIIIRLYYVLLTRL